MVIFGIYMAMLDTGMKLKLKQTIIATLLAAICSSTVTAGSRLGLQARVGVNLTDVSLSGENLNLSSRLGVHAAIALPVSLGISGTLGIQPELMYLHNTYRLNDEKVRLNNVALPVMGTVRVFPFLKVFVGPTISLSDNSYYRVDGERCEFGTTQPTITYMAGVALQRHHLLLDCRYHGLFNRTKNYFEGTYPRVRSNALLLSIGYAF
jgi:hypothetical protein